MDTHQPAPPRWRSRRAVLREAEDALGIARRLIRVRQQARLEAEAARPAPGDRSLASYQRYMRALEILWVVDAA